MTKSSRTWWDRFLFRDKGIIPTQRLLTCLFILAICLTAFSFLNVSWPFYFILNGVFLLGSLLDFFFLPKRGHLDCRRQIDNELERDQPFEVMLTIQNQSHVPVRYRLIDSLPKSFVRPFPIEGMLSARNTVKLTYPSNPPVRGDYELDRVYFRYRSLMGLWEKQTTFQTHSRFKVIPDMTSVRNLLTDAEQALIREGMKVRRHQVGSGEFAHIRSYVFGDDPRKINWHQSAKLSEVMTNVYEPEHGKHVTILIDCGRSMGVELTKSNRLELSIEAALTVAASALRNGDYVTVLAFSNQIEAYVPAGKGIAHQQTIIHRIYALKSVAYESHYEKAFAYLESKQKRRSLLVMFSHLDVLMHDETVLFYMQRLKRRHLFFMLGISDPMTADWIAAEPNDSKQAMLKSIAQKDRIDRNKQLARWNRMGVEILEVDEEKLAITALNRYVELINKGTL